MLTDTSGLGDSYRVVDHHCCYYYAHVNAIYYLYYK
jgi:hypothetical protein